MKRYIKSFPIVINVDVLAYHPLLLIDLDDSEVVASYDIYKMRLPNGRVISKEKNRITGAMRDDFESFMETVEDFCEENCGLVGTYKNVSNDNSYYNYLATDGEGNIMIDYRFRLRISNHDPKRSKQQKQNKKEETSSEKLKQLLDEHEIDKLKKYTQVVIVNNERFESYGDAVETVFSLIEDAVKVMTKNKEPRPKKPIVD